MCDRKWSVNDVYIRLSRVPKCQSGGEDGLGSIYRRSHRTGCTGPDPTNFWESNMGPAQICVAKYYITSILDPIYTNFSTPAAPLLGRIGLKEKVDFQLFVELRGRQWDEWVAINIIYNSWFEYVTLQNEHADVWAVNFREYQLRAWWICQ